MRVKSPDVQRDGLAVDGGYDLFSGADVDSASSDSGEHLAALLGDDGDKGGGRSRRPFPKVLGEPVRIVGIEGESQSADEALRQNLLSRVRRDYRWRLFGLGRGVAVQCWNVRTGNVSSRSSGRIETPGEVAKGFQVSLAAGFLERAADDGRCHVLAVDSCNIFVPRHFLTKHREEHWIP
ncbi:hypothetical protein DIPPA_33290 [Diplonema papillatum]|nr:hypothetical protein DIPPA_33290 [Diplonema papillatum]